MATQAGQRISDINELKTLKESDLARVGTDIYRRDLAKEQEFAKTVNPADKDAFNKAVYGAPIQPKDNAPEPEVLNKETLFKNIETTSAGKGDVPANSAFIQGVSKYATGKAATPEDLAAGGTVRDVINRFGIADKLPGFNIPDPEPKVEEVDNTPVENKSAQQKIQDLLSGFGDDKAAVVAGARKDAGLAEKSQAITDAQKRVNDLRTALQDQQVMDIREADEVRAKPLLRSTINIRMDELSREQKLDLMLKQNEYNNALVEESIAQGDYTRAESLVKETASDFYQNMQLQLQALQAEGKIEEAEAKSLETQANFERELALKGYVPLTDEQAVTVRDVDLFTDPVSGKKYKKPATVGDTFTLSPGQTRFDENGNIIATVVKTDGNALDELLSPNELALFPSLSGGATMRDAIGLYPKSELTGVQKFTQEIKLGKEFENLVGDSRSAATAVENINSSLGLAEKAIKEGKSINAASQGVLVAFQKLLDPSSVVRESEYARSGNGQSLMDRMEGTWQKVKQGGAGVTPEELNNFVETANVFLKGYENTALKHAKRMTVIAERQGLDINSILTEDMVKLVYNANKPVVYTSVKEWQDTNPENLETIKQIVIDEDMNEEEALQLINRMNERSSFNNVESDTNTALPEKAAKADIGDDGGQCGRFVNNATGLGVGDSFSSKMAKMDSSIKEPEPGMVFTMPYKDTGHCGFIVGVDGDNVLVKDSNWSLDEKVKTHIIPKSKITGLKRV